MKFSIETCHVDRFIDNEWNLVDTLDDLNAAVDAMKSPIFYVEDWMLIRVREKLIDAHKELIRVRKGEQWYYLGVYHQGDWIMLDERDLLFRFPWNYTNHAIEFKKNKPWIEAWRTSESPSEMMDAIDGVVPDNFRRNATVECARTLIGDSSPNKANTHRLMDHIKTATVTPQEISQYVYIPNPLRAIMYNIAEPNDISFTYLIGRILMAYGDSATIAEEILLEMEFSRILRREIPMREILAGFIRATQ